MKIVDVAETFAPKGGGVRTYMMHKFQAAAAAGHRLTVVAPGAEDGFEELPGGKIVWLKSPKLPLDPRYHMFVRAARVFQTVDAEQPDILEISSPQASGWFAARHETAARKVFVFHTDVLAVHAETFLGHHLGFEVLNKMAWPYWKTMQRLSRRYDATIVSGDWLKSRLQAHGVAHVVTVPFGIDKEHFGAHHRRAAVRAELIEKAGAPADAHLLICVGRLVPEKRVKLIVKAFRQAAQQRPLALAVFGGGPLSSFVEKEASGSSGIYFAGHTTDRAYLSSALASADALLHGSAAETFGIAVAEALTSGTPAIVPNRGGAAALVRGGSGIHYKAGNVDQCAGAIDQFLNTDLEAARTSAVEIAASIPSAQEHFEHLFELYERLGRAAK